MDHDCDVEGDHSWNENREFNIPWQKDNNEDAGPGGESIDAHRSNRVH